MLALLGLLTIVTGTCLACAGSKSGFQAEVEVASGMLLVVGLFMIGVMLPYMR